MAIRLQANPIIVKEIRSRMRGARAFVLLTGFLLGLGVVGYGLYLYATSSASSGAVVISSQIGQTLFAGLAFTLLVLICLVTPAVTVGAISSERERLTYDMLVATPLHPARLLWGKLISSLSYVFLLILAAVPLGSIVFLFGGIGLKDLLKALALICMTAIMTGTLGLFASALTRRTGRAAVLTYLLVALMVVGLLFGAGLYHSRNAYKNVPQALLAPNPVSGMASVIAPLTSPANSNMMGPIFMEKLIIDMAVPIWGGSGGFGGQLTLPGWNILSVGVWTEPTQKQMEQGLPFTPVARGIWRDTLIIELMVTLLLFWLTLHLVRPRRYLRPGREDLLMSIVTTGMLLGAGFWRGWW